MLYHVLALKLTLCEGEFSEFPGKFEGSEDGVLAGEGDEGGGGESSVGVNTTSGVPETVLSSRLCAVLTPAPGSPPVRSARGR